jgi:hypothetical protein
MLLLLLPKKIEDIFEFISSPKLIESKSSKEKTDTIIIDYSYANFVYTINIFADDLTENQIYIKDNSKIDINVDDYILFTKGSAAGKLAKIENLILYKNHLKINEIDKKILTVSNTIIIKTKLNDEVKKGFYELILFSLFFKDVRNKSIQNKIYNEYTSINSLIDNNEKNQIYYESTLINSLSQKNEKNEKLIQFSLSIKDIKDVVIIIPNIEIQTRLIEQFNEHKITLMSRLPNAKNFTKLIAEIQLSLTQIDYTYDSQNK